MKFVHEMLKHVATGFPKHIAIKYRNNSVSYALLDRMSDRLCLYLLENGVQKGEPVGIYIHKSIDAVIAIIAVLKSGACYVPLDCSAPGARIDFIVKDAKINKVLTGNHEYPSAANIFTSHDILLLPVNQQKPVGELQDFRPPPLYNDSLAAILYTSGSTGTPKGAMISHGNLMSFVEWAVSQFDLNSDDRLLGHAPFMFDISFFDIFAAFCSCATLVLPEQSVISNGKLLYQFTHDECITIWQSVPSALTLLCHSNKDTELSPLTNIRAVLFSGERMPNETLRSIFRHFVNAKIYNIYGCTETNNTFIYQVNRNEASENSLLPIGKPLPMVSYMIVDEKGKEVSDGGIGHLLVSTPTMMIGYTDLELTKNVFLSKQLGPEPKRRYYCTNDLVVKREDNNLIFLGRRDSIVKSNGYRVNLMEIELVLQRLPYVQEVAVYAVPNDLIGNRIVASVQSLDHYKIDSLELKLACSKFLPKYSIPHEFIISCNPIPKTINGKIDKSLLSNHSTNHLNT